MSSPTECFLFDNGSLRAGSTLSLRRIARALSGRLDLSVRPVSLLHSSAVNPRGLDGVPAELLEPAVVNALSAGLRSAVLLPLFFGPSAALTVYLPQRLRSVLRSNARAEIRLGRWLVDVNAASDRRIADGLAGRVRERIAEGSLGCPPVVLVDHGSPQREVGAVRDFLGDQLRTALGNDARSVTVASMERRPGDVYAFNEPLLAGRLRTAPCNSGDVVIALQFLSPGRHAGPQGDIAAICARAESEQPGLKTHLTEPLGADPRLVDVLVDRYREAVSGRPFA